CGSWCAGGESGLFGSGRGALDSAVNFLSDVETIRVNLNIVYDSNQLTKQQVREAMKPLIKDLSDTFGQINIRFNVSYTAGTVNSSRTEITSGAIAGSINVFYFDDSEKLYSYSKYETKSRQIFISQKRGSETIRAGTLSHEIGHLFGIIGSVTSTLVHYIGNVGNNPITNTIDNVTSDIQIETANAWLRNGLAVYSRDWVDNYRTETTTTETLINAWAVAKVGAQPKYNKTTVPRTPTILDLYRGGARSVAAQRKK
ncbi:MAG: hypothetical protein C4287_23475, partial [Leptolyngbya sp. ERB_1_2]